MTSSRCPALRHRRSRSTRTAHWLPPGRPSSWKTNRPRPGLKALIRPIRPRPPSSTWTTRSSKGHLSSTRQGALSPRLLPHPGDPQGAVAAGLLRLVGREKPQHIEDAHSHVGVYRGPAGQRGGGGRTGGLRGVDRRPDLAETRGLPKCISMQATRCGWSRLHHRGGWHHRRPAGSDWCAGDHRRAPRRRLYRAVEG